MRVPLRRAVASLIAAAAFASGSVRAADAPPPAHALAKGEHFSYTLALTFLLDERAVVDGPRTMSSIADLDVLDVSASGATIRERVRYDSATGFGPQTNTILAGGDGPWRYAGLDRVANNFATWDVAQLGMVRPALAPGQRWELDVPRSALWDGGHAVVRVVSVDGTMVAVHVDGTLAGGGAWQSDATYANGILRDLHRIDTTPPGTNGNSAGTRLDYRVRLVQHRS